MKRDHVIYKLILETKDGLYYYIGCTVNLKKRFGDHLIELKNGTHRNRDFQEKFNGLDKQNLSCVVLEKLSNVSQKEARKRERFYIESFSPPSRLFNREFTQKVSDFMKDVWKRPDFLEKMKNKWTPTARRNQAKNLVETLGEPVTIHEKTYPTGREAGDILGMHSGKISSRILSKNVLFWRWFKTREGPKKNFDYFRTYVVEGVLYPSPISVSKVYGVSPDTVRSRCKSPSKDWKDWYLWHDYVLKFPNKTEYEVFETLKETLPFV